MTLRAMSSFIPLGPKAGDEVIQTRFQAEPPCWEVELYRGFSEGLEPSVLGGHHTADTWGHLIYSEAAVQTYLSQGFLQPTSLHQMSRPQLGCPQPFRDARGTEQSELPTNRSSGVGRRSQAARSRSVHLRHEAGRDCPAEAAGGGRRPHSHCTLHGSCQVSAGVACPHHSWTSRVELMLGTHTPPPLAGLPCVPCA